MKKVNFQRSLQIIILSIFLFSFISCEPEDTLKNEENLNALDLRAERSNPTEKINEFFGPTQPIGKGIARSYVSFNHDGVPISIGVLFSEKALDNLGLDPINLTLELHSKGKGLLVDHIDFGYNPNGHPGEVFMVEHFDLHFYWISIQEKLGIPYLFDFTDLPDASTWPEGYEFEPVTVPEMGRHWVTEEQMESEDFDETFIYGSYSSEFIFYEPMITMEYFRAKDFEDSYEITPLGAYERAGYYAESYKIMFDEVKKQYIVELTNLFWEDGQN